MGEGICRLHSSLPCHSFARRDRQTDEYWPRTFWWSAPHQFRYPCLFWAFSNLAEFRWWRKNAFGMVLMSAKENQLAHLTCFMMEHEAFIYVYVQKRTCLENIHRGFAIIVVGVDFVSAKLIQPKGFWLFWDYPLKRFSILFVFGRIKTTQKSHFTES